MNPNFLGNLLVTLIKVRVTYMFSFLQISYLCVSFELTNPSSLSVIFPQNITHVHDLTILLSSNVKHVVRIKFMTIVKLTQ